jgi:hypothetical protein
MPYVNEDYNGHRSLAGGTALAAGAVNTTVAGTIVPTTAAGAAPTVTAVAASDTYGRFTLNPVTGGGAQAAGATSHVYFSTLYSQAPRSVMVTIINATVPATPVAQAAYATAITAAGFDITTPILTTANNYVVDYVVQP